MSALSDIRAAFAEALSPLPETTHVLLGPGKYDMGADRFIVQVIVGPVSPEAEDRLDVLLGRSEGSICGLVEADPTLGGTVGALVVRSHNGQHTYRTHEGAEPELGSELTVEVHRLPEH